MDTKTSPAYSEGFNAFRRGVARCTNPHRNTPDEYSRLAWDDGYDSANPDRLRPAGEFGMYDAATLKRQGKIK